MNANEYKDNVRASMRSGSGLSEAEFDRINTEYDAYNFLMKYALSSWMASEFPELDAAVRTREGGWELYKSAGGAVGR
jgi:hypothetical protein